MCRALKKKKNLNKIKAYKKNRLKKQVFFHKKKKITAQPQAAES